MTQIQDIKELLKHYNFKAADLTPERLRFRLGLLQEEHDELLTAYDNDNAEEFVDALIDMVVIAIGTLELCGVDSQRAWSEVHRANMTKLKGAKPGRQSDGWDLYKPLNWIAPTHADNVGMLPKILKETT